MCHSWWPCCQALGPRLSEQMQEVLVGVEGKALGHEIRITRETTARNAPTLIRAPDAGQRPEAGTKQEGAFWEVIARRCK